MGSQLWTSPLELAPIADGAALASSAALTDVSPTPQLVLPANFLYPGMALKIRAAGRFSNTGTPTLLIGVYLGGVAGVALTTTGAITGPSGVTNQTWDLDALLVVRSAGSSGSIMAIGKVSNIAGTPGVSSMMPASAPAVATIDTTAAKALTIGAQWGTPSASNTLTVHTFEVETLG